MAVQIRDGRFVVSEPEEATDYRKLAMNIDELMQQRNAIAARATMAPGEFTAEDDAALKTLNAQIHEMSQQIPQAVKAFLGDAPDLQDIEEAKARLRPIGLWSIFKKDADLANVLNNAQRRFGLDALNYMRHVDKSGNVVWGAVTPDANEPEDPGRAARNRGIAKQAPAKTGIFASHAYGGSGMGESLDMEDMPLDVLYDLMAEEAHYRGLDRIYGAHCLADGCSPELGAKLSDIAKKWGVDIVVPQKSKNYSTGSRMGKVDNAIVFSKNDFTPGSYEAAVQQPGADYLNVANQLSGASK